MAATPRALLAALQGVAKPLIPLALLLLLLLEGCHGLNAPWRSRLVGTDVLLEAARATGVRAPWNAPKVRASLCVLPLSVFRAGCLRTRPCKPRSLAHPVRAEGRVEERVEAA
jgi:hypothetical protein